MKLKNSYTSTPAFLSPKSQAEAERLKHFADMVYMNCALMNPLMIFIKIIKLR